MSTVGMLKQMIINNAREKGVSCGKIDINGAVQFYRWLLYMPDFYQKYIDNISSKSVDDLSFEELCDYIDFIKL